jgi:hypothetical protein
LLPIPDSAGALSVDAGLPAPKSAANPAVGVSVSATSTYVVDWVGRTREHAEQQAIANVAGPMTVGRKAPWRTRDTVPIGNEHGDVCGARIP